MLSSRKLLFKFHSNMLDLTISSALQTFRSWRDSLTLEGCYSRITIFTVSFRFPNWRRSRAWHLCQSRATRYQTQCFWEPSSCTDSPTSPRSMAIRSPIRISRRQGSSSNTSIRSFQRPPSSRPRFKKKLMVMRARKIGSSKSKITDYKQRKMQRQRRTSWTTWHNSPFRKMLKLMSWTRFGERHSKRSLFSPWRSWPSPMVTTCHTSERTQFSLYNMLVCFYLFSRPHVYSSESQSLRRKFI